MFSQVSVFTRWGRYLWYQVPTVGGNTQEGVGIPGRG